MTLPGPRAWAVPKWAAQTSHGRKSSSGEVSFCLLSGPGSGLVVAAVVVQAAVQDADEPVGQGAQSLVVGWAAMHFPDRHLIDSQAASWLLRYSSWTSCGVR